MADSSSVNYSSSSSFIPDYSETTILDQIAQTASDLGQAQYTWAQQQFAANSALTDQAVTQYLSSAASADALAQNNISRYENIYQPEENQLVADAQSYSSLPRIQQQMGEAESGAGQAMDASMQNANAALQSYGIDPSSGRYAELDQAENAQRGAAQAAAAQQAEYNTENEGRTLTNEAVQVGEQYPGQIVNSLNSEVQGLAGAVNAQMANTNTGVAAFNSADQYLNTAMALKYPPLGNSSSSTGQSQSSGNNGSGQSTSKPSTGSSGSGSAPSSNPYLQTPSQGVKTISGAGSGNANASIMNTGNGGSTGNDWTMNTSDPFNTYGTDTNAYTNYDPNGLSQFSDPTAMGGQTDPFNTYGQDVGAYTNSSGSSSDPFSGWNDYTGANTGGQNFGSAGDTSYSSDPTSGFSDYSSGTGFDNSAPTGGINTDAGTSSDSWNDPSSAYSSDYNTGGADFGSSGDPNYTSDPTAGYSDYSSGSYDNSGSDYSSGDYAAGGPIVPRGPARPMQRPTGRPMPGQRPTTGGFVPPQASPSRGRLQDDVPANLNEGEFVVPRDVAMWKGQEFFQKLIDQSRKSRMGASAHGKPGQMQPGPARFASHATR